MEMRSGTSYTNLTLYLFPKKRYPTNMTTKSGFDAAVDLIDGSHIRTIKVCLTIPE